MNIIGIDPSITSTGLCINGKLFNYSYEEKAYTKKGLGTNDFFILLATDGYIDWGDTNITSVNSTSDVSYLHTYSTSGSYQIKLYGGIDYLSHSSSNNDLKVISIDQ